MLRISPQLIKRLSWMLLALVPVSQLASCKKPDQGAPVTEVAPKTQNEPAAPASPAPTTPGGDKISFSSQVRPILSNNCFACHGPDSANQSSPFRLDTAEHSRANLAKEGDPPRYGIVPGKPEESLLLKRIVASDPHEVMPPPESKKKPLTEEEVAIVTEWIRQGANYEPHWAFVPPVKPVVPKVTDKAWPRTPIDNFILATLESKGIAPSPEADKETLVRRVHLDLLGLPPTPEEIDAFLADTSDKAYEQMVDRALASPHYGERMAIDWLDLARFGDTNVLQADNVRTSWPWRDWVINAFNNNMPYDQFITEQLAGDLLPNATLQQKVATSFNRNHGINNEAGSIPEEWLVEYAVDRVSTYGTAVMGMTIGCARCHDHKFDPITQDDFFSLMAYFNSIDERGVEMHQNGGNRGRAYPPFIQLPTAQQKDALDASNKTLAALQPIRSNKAPNAVAVPDERKALEWSGLTATSATCAKQKIEPITKSGLGGTAASNFDIPENSNRVLQEGTLCHLNFPVVGGEIVTIEFNLPEKPFNTVRIDSVNPFDFLWNLQPDETDHVWGMDLKTVRQALPEIEIELIEGKARRPLPIVMARSTFQDIIPELAAATATDPANSWKLGIPGIDSTALLQLNAPIKPAKDAKLVIKFKFSGTEVPYLNALTNSLGVSVANNPHGLDDWLALFNNKDRKYWMNDTYLASKAHAAGSSPITGIDVARAHYLKYHVDNYATRVMVMEERKEPLKTYVLDRGAYDKPLKNRPRERTTPVAFPPLPKDAPKNRLGLAQWSLASENPLTARVQVNRLWQQIFRHGIVKTSEDLGLQSSLPTHPEFLDYLAVDFRENGWDIKRAIKKIVMSATYRQSSKHREDLKEIDPENKLLARSPRYRLPAELIRDNALSASGLLNAKIGGPSVKTYQPEIWREKSSFNRLANYGVFTRHTGDKLFRRGLYTFWRQSVPPAQMLIFDAPSREACVSKRESTNTPLQAFVLMNDETYLEFSRKLAERLFTDINGAWEERLAERLRRGFRLATGRKPNDSELEKWISFTNDTLERFTANTENAEQFLSYGETPRNKDLPTPQLAALSFSMSAILNLDETITRD